MLWYKAWLDTRWRFIVGLTLVVLSAVVVVFGYDAAMEEVRRAQAIPGLAAAVAAREAQIADFRGFVWHTWIFETLRQLLALFAVMLGAGGLAAQVNRGGGVFLLSLPVSRTQVLLARAGVGLLQLAVLALVPLVVVTLVAPLAGERFSLTDALAFGACLFTGTALLFSATTALSTWFADVWRAPLLVLCFFVIWGFFGVLLPGEVQPIYNVLNIMTGEPYFAGTRFPLVEVLLLAVTAAALLFSARLNLERRDF